MNYLSEDSSLNIDRMHYISQVLRNIQILRAELKSRNHHYDG